MPRIVMLNTTGTTKMDSTGMTNNCTRHVHIVIPYFGSFELLETAVLSVLKQTSVCWKLTVIDDFTGNVELAPFISSLGDERIQLIHNPKNFGIAKNFQEAIALADQDLLTIMGCDDVLLSDYVGKCLELFEKFPTASYIQPGVEVIDEKGNIHLGITDRVKRKLMNQPSFPAVLEGENLARSLSDGCWTYFPSLCWNTAVIKKYGFRSDFSIVLDLDLQMRIICDGGTLVVDNQPVFQYRRHRASASMTAAVDGKRFNEERRLYAQLEQNFADKGWKKAGRAAKWRLTSRLNSGLHLALCLVTFKFAFVPKLWRHTFS